jgi:hypothetical protein
MNLLSCILNLNACLVNSGNNIGNLTLIFTIFCSIISAIWALYTYIVAGKNMGSASKTDSQSIKTGAINNSKITINQKK